MRPLTEKKLAELALAFCCGALAGYLLAVVPHTNDGEPPPGKCREHTVGSHILDRYNACQWPGMHLTCNAEATRCVCACPLPEGSGT